jgi:hypothetical protein
MATKSEDSIKLIIIIGGAIGVWYGGINFINNSTKKIEIVKIIDTRTEVVNTRRNTTRAFIDIQLSSANETVMLDDWDKKYSNKMLEMLRSMTTKKQCAKIEIYGQVPQYPRRVISKVEAVKCNDNSL